MGAILSASWSLTLEPQLSWGQICLCPTRRQWSMCGDTLDMTKQAHTTGAFLVTSGVGVLLPPAWGRPGMLQSLLQSTGQLPWQSMIWFRRSIARNWETLLYKPKEDEWLEGSWRIVGKPHPGLVTDKDAGSAYLLWQSSQQLPPNHFVKRPHIRITTPIAKPNKLVSKADLFEDLCP